MSKQKPVKQTVTKTETRQVSWWANPRSLALGVFAFSFLIYFNTVFNDYNMDDELVTINHRLTSKGISAIPEIFNSPYFEDKTGVKYEYRPMVLTTFAIEHSLFGDNPHMGHFINVLLYAAMCALLFYLLAGLLHNYSILLPLLITILYAAHPIHTEVVASIKNRDELLALLFGLLSLWAALRFSQSNKILYLLLIPVFFVSGLLSKTTTITFAVIIPLSLVMLSGVGFRSLMLITAVMVLPTVLYARLYTLTQQVGLGVVLFVAVAALYFIKNGLALTYGLPGGVKQAWQNLFARSEPAQQQENYQLDFTFLKQPFSAITTVLLLLLPLAAGVAGILLGNVWLTCIPLALLAAAYLLVKRELQLLLVVPIAAITLFALATFDFRYTLVEGFFLLFVATLLVTPDKRFRIMGLVVLAAHIIIAVTIMRSHLFVAVLIFAWFADKRLRWVSATAMVLTLVYWLGFGYHIARGAKSFRMAYLAYPLLYAGAFLIWKGQTKLLVRVTAFAVPVLLLVSFFSAPKRHYQPALNKMEIGYYAAARLQPADPTPEQSGRPLRYMEFPIDDTTAVTVKLGTALVVLGKYFKMVFVPYPMSFYYGYSYIKPTDLFKAGPLIVLFIYLALFVLGIFFIRRRPLLSYGILLYLVTIAAYSTLATPIPGMLGDRFLLIPSLGFAFVLVYIIGMAFKQDFTDKTLALPALKQPVKISLAVLLVIYSVGTFARNLQWKNHLTLFSRDIEFVDNSSYAHNLLGVQLLVASQKEGDFTKRVALREQAIEHFKQSLAIYPGYLNPAYDLGRAYQSMGGDYAVARNIPKANEYWAKAVEQYKEVVKLDSNFYTPYYEMGIISRDMQDLPAEIQYFEKYLQKYPDNKDVYASISFAWFQLKQPDSSIAVNRRLLQKIPNGFEPLINIAKVHLANNRLDSATVYLEHCYQLNPTDPEPLKILLHISKVQNNKQNELKYRHWLVRAPR